MKRRGGSPRVSSLCFYSDVAQCLLWQKMIMRKEEGRYQRDERREEGRGVKKLDQWADFL